MKTTLPYNLHSHTKRCGHAYGEDFEYCDAAIKAGFRELGFSDHVMLPGVSQPGIRAEYTELGNYLGSVAGLKEAYQDRLLIRTGFEAEWLGEEFADYYRYLLSREDVDYLILGQHAFITNKKLVFFSSLDEEEGPRRYAESLVEGMRSGLFTLVAHPDYFTPWVDHWDERCAQYAHLIAKTAKEMNLPLEINGSYSRSKPDVLTDPTSLLTPCPMFWDIVAQYDVDVVIGVDAHSPSHYEVTDYDALVAFAGAHGLKLLPESPLSLKK